MKPTPEFTPERPQGPAPAQPFAPDTGPRPGNGWPQRAWSEFLVRGVQVILLLVLGIASLAFLGAVNDAIETWFRPQWVPLARAATALLVIVAAAAALLQLSRRGTRNVA